MRDMPYTIQNLLAGESLRPFYLLHFEVDSSHYRYTDCDVPIAYGGALYTPRWLRVPTIESSLNEMVSKFKIRLDNRDQLLMIPFVGGQAGGSPIDCRLVFLDDDYQLVSDVTGPVGRWIVSEGLGNYAPDWSGNNNHGTLEWVTGGQATWTFDTMSALDFTSANAQRVNLGQPSELCISARPFAISLWTKPESLSAWRTLFSWSKSTWDAGYGIGMDDAGNLTFWVNEYANNKAYKAFSTTGSWVHVLAEWKADGTIQIYIDNVAGTSDSYTGTVTSPGSKNVAIAGYDGGGSGCWDGMIANVQCFNRDLTAAERTILFAGGYVGQGSILLFDGEVDSFEVDEEAADITGLGELSQWTRTTLNPQVEACRWRIFKGVECTYSGGETWCDRTYTRCAALENTANFGGERWIGSLRDRKIWWGY